MQQSNLTEWYTAMAIFMIHRLDLLMNLLWHFLSRIATSRWMPQEYITHAKLLTQKFWQNATDY